MFPSTGATRAARFPLSRLLRVASLSSLHCSSRLFAPVSASVRTAYNSVHSSFARENNRTRSQCALLTVPRHASLLPLLLLRGCSAAARQLDD